MPFKEPHGQSGRPSRAVVRKGCRAVALVACSSMLLASNAKASDGIPGASASTTIGLGALADTSTRSDRPRSTHGRATRLHVSAGRTRRRAFLRFALPARPGRVVRRATLRIRAGAPAGRAVVALRSVGRTRWRETTLAWRDQPSVGRVVDRASRFAKGSWVSFDATRLVRAARHGRVAMALVASSTSGSTSFASREARKGRPRLVVRTESPSPSPGPFVMPTPITLATPIATATPTPSATPTATPAPTATPTPARWYPLRGVFFRQSDGGFDVQVAHGFNLIDSSPGEVSELPAGVKGLTWVGDYNKTSCTWQVTDAQLTSYVTAHKGDPKVGVWFISDEPWIGGTPHCPGAPAQHKARSELIHSIDPAAKTLMVVDSNSGQESLDQLPDWKGITDYIGLNPYMCRQGEACHYEWIDELAQTADASGLSYWGVVQAYGDPAGAGQEMCTTTSGCGMARLPTASEIHEEFVHWRATAMSSYLVFSWRWPDDTPSLWLENHQELQAQLAAEAGA